MPHQAVWFVLLAAAAATVLGILAWRVLRVRAQSQRASEIAIDTSDLGGLTGESALTFRRLVHEFFERRGLAHEVGVQSVDMNNSTDTESVREFGLTNLAQSCAQTKRSAWKQTIEEYFDGMLASDAEHERFDRLAGDWDRISSHLAVRIYANDMVGLLDPSTASDTQRPDFEGTLSCLVIDMPTTMRSVRHEETIPWNKSKAKMFEVALLNVWRSSRPTIERTVSAATNAHSLKTKASSPRPTR